MCKRYFFILFVLKICTFRFANYKYTINKRIIKQSNNKLDKKKNRYNIVYYSGFMIDDISLLMISYLPMQNLSNIFPNTWSVVTSPTISERWKIHSLKSWEMKSPERLADKPSWTRWMDSRAWVRAS